MRITACNSQHSVWWTTLFWLFAAALCVAIVPRWAEAQSGCSALMGCDGIAPTVWLAPVSGTHQSIPQVVISADACDNFEVASLDLELNTNWVQSGYDDGSGCASASASVTLSPGANTVRAVACDYSGNCQTKNSTVYYDAPVPPTYGVAVSPASASLGSLGMGTRRNATFGVTNTSTTLSTLNLSWSCSGAASCDPGSAAIQRGSNVTESWDVAFTVTGTGAGAITLVAANAEPGGKSASGTQSVTGIPPVTVGVYGHGPTTVERDHGGVSVFTVTNTTSSGPGASFNFTPACPITTWNCTASPASAALGPQESVNVTVALTGRGYGPYTVWLSASGAASGSGSNTVTVTSPYAVGVTAGSSQSSYVGTRATQSFTVSNTSGFDEDLMLSVVNCSGAIRDCAVQTSVSLGPRQSVPINVAYTGQFAGTGSIGLRAQVSQDTVVANQVTTSVTVTTPPANVPPAVGPDGPLASLVAGQSGTYLYPLSNPGTTIESYVISIADCGGGVLQSCTVTPSSILNMPPGPGSPLQVQFTVPAGTPSGWTGRVSVKAALQRDPSVFDIGYGEVTVAPSPTPAASSVVITNGPPSGRVYLDSLASRQFTAEVRDANGTALPNESVNWASSDSSVASVTGSGVVTARRRGRARVTARSSSNAGLSAWVDVVTGPVPANIVFDSVPGLVTGQARDIVVSVRDALGSILPGQSVQFSVTDPTVVALLNPGDLRVQAKGLRVGSTSITARAEDERVALTRAQTVVVGDPPPASVPSSVRISMARPLLEVRGDTGVLMAAVLDQYGQVMTAEAVEWANRPPYKAMLTTATGTQARIVGTSPGYAMIVATARNGVADSVAVRVLERWGTPAVSLAPEQPSHLFRDVSRCAEDCFEAVNAYSTPSHVSLDQEHSVTFMHRSGYRNGRATVLLDVDPQSFLRPTYVRLELKRSNGAVISSGRFFQVDTTGPTRVAASFTTTALPEGLNNVIAVVTTRWSDSTRATESSIPILVTNPPATRLPNNWFVAGFPEINAVAGGYLAFDGTGSVSFFAESCSTQCTYVSPPGDPSTLTRTVTELIRRYPDGTTVIIPTGGTTRRVCDRFGACTQFTTNSYGVAAVRWPAGDEIKLWWGGFADPLTEETLWVPYSVSLPRLDGGLPDRYVSIEWAPTSVRFSDARGAWQYNHALVGGAQIVASMVAPNGGQWNLGYLASGELWTIDSPPVGYDPGVYMSARTRVIPPRGLLLEQLAMGRGTGEWNAVDWRLDKRAAIVGPRNDTTFFALNRWRSPIRVDAPLTQPVLATYDDATGNPTRVIPGNGTSVRMVWKGALLDSLIDESTGAVQVFTYDTEFAQPTGISGTAPTQVIEYDLTRRGHPLKSVTVAGATTRYVLDTLGRVLTVTDPEGHVTTTAYLNNGSRNTDSIVGPGTKQVRFAYDVYGRPVLSKPLGGATDSTVWDAANRPSEVFEKDQGVFQATRRTSYGYYSNQLRSLTDPRQQIYSFGPSALGWLDYQDDALGRRESYGHDVAGNRVRVMTRAYEIIRTAYDLLGRPVADSSGGVELRRVQYDPQGRWVSYRNAYSTDVVHLSSRGTVDSVVTTRGARRYRLVARYGDSRFPSVRTDATLYDGTSRPLATQHLELNDAGAVKGLYGGGIGDLSIQFRYNRDMVLDSLIHPSGVVRRRQVGIHSTAKSIYSPLGMDRLLGERYAYDSLGRITERQLTAADTVRFYRYDQFGQLRQEGRLRRSGATCSPLLDLGDRCTGGQEIPVESSDIRGYDAVGNPAGVGESVTGNQLTQHGRYSYTYDLNGRMTRKYLTANPAQSDQTFKWNVLDQLTKVLVLRSGAGVSPGQLDGLTSVEFRYDALGRRIGRTVIHGQDTVTTEYLWDGDEVMAELDGAGQLKREITSLGPDAVFGIRKAGASGAADSTFTLWTDELGNVRGATAGGTQATTVLVAGGDYTGFGTLLPLASANGLPHPALALGRGFKGAAYDPETGLSYMRARFYDAEAERFMSEDLLGLEAGLNPYVFADNDPVNYADPSGLNKCSAKQEAEGFITVRFDDSGNEWCYRPITPVTLPPIISTAPWNYDPPSGRALRPFGSGVASANSAAARTNGGGCASGANLPVHGRVTSPFGPRTHPKTHVPGSQHWGIDIAAASGTPVYPAWPGTARVPPFNDVAGNNVRIVHPNGMTTRYLHLSVIYIASGASVEAGTVIGLVGATGSATGPHLHFEVKPTGGSPIDPSSCFK